MGKPTGFLEYTRREDGRRPPVHELRRPLLPGGDDI